MNWYKIIKNYEDSLFVRFLINKYQKKLNEDIKKIMYGDDVMKDPGTFTGLAARYGL